MMLLSPPTVKSPLLNRSCPNNQLYTVNSLKFPQTYEQATRGLSVLGSDKGGHRHTPC